MKNVFLFLISFISLSIFCKAQQSSDIYFHYLKDHDLRLSNSFHGIDIFHLISSDKKLFGKKFLLHVKEFKEGIVINTDSLHLNCKPHEFPVSIGEDSMVYRINPCDALQFNKGMKSYDIAFASKQESDSLHLIIDYALRNSYHYKMKGTERYDFRPLTSDVVDLAVEKGTVQVGIEHPIISYAEGVELAPGLANYCLLDLAPVDEWYETFGLNHFYIIYLVIAD